MFETTLLAQQPTQDQKHSAGSQNFLVDEPTETCPQHVSFPQGPLVLGSHHHQCRPMGLCDHGPVTVLLWAWSPLETGAAAPPCPSGLHEGDYGTSVPPEFASMPQGSRLGSCVPLRAVLKSRLGLSAGDSHWTPG